ncbi:MAG: sigma-70 family RNA polymerase sigma factor [Planctomycetes bacterium]|nr:sigma-70 family RNA polymerase sigma factor [Planctomycetota bacterium]
MEKSNIELMRAAAAGDAGAYAAFARRHAGAVLRYCLTRLANEQAAEDATQEAMLRVFQQVRAGGTPAEPLGWLFGVARNCCNEVVRQRLRHEAAALPEDLEARPAAAHWSPELADLLGRLSDAEQGLIQMKYTERLTCREIAERSGIPIGTVKASLARAYQKLRRHLRPEMEGEQR